MPPLFPSFGFVRPIKSDPTGQLKHYSSRRIIDALRNRCSSARYCLSQDGLQCRNTTSQGHGTLASPLATDSGLSDVTDRSRQQDRGVFPAKSFWGWNVFAGSRLECRFLGRKRPLRWWALGRHFSSPSLAPAAKEAGFLGERFRPILERFTGSGRQGHAPVRSGFV
jgi:hypothetical protein